MECLLLLCNIFIYSQLMAYFDKDERDMYDKRLSAIERKRASIALICFMVTSQMVYFIYFCPSIVQAFLFHICAVMSGVWTNLLGMVAGFFIINITTHVLNKFPSTMFIVTMVKDIPYIGSIVFNRKHQIRVLLGITALMSLLMLIGSDNIVVKHITIPVAVGSFAAVSVTMRLMLNAFNNFSGTGGNFKIALVSDIHAGATIAKVVDKLLSMDVDMVALVGDMVDGSVEVLADYMEPLWSLHYRFRTYFVTGNHEYYYGNAEEWFREYDRHGIRVLDNRCEMFRNVCIVGVNDISSEYSGVVLAHNPASVLKFSSADLSEVDVVLSGHTHAAQYYVLAPIVYWVLPYFHGLYEIGHSSLFVSAGTLYQGAPMKMLWMSEIWVITLKKKRAD
uniref:Transmembrane protein with metallophosphoesterase domain (inferred by orthology to a human protein) n=1 Tax=Nippostrongylus brasiliensis TaxID=27835 RepID=A0A0N4Y1X9_NIPBR